MTTATLQSKVRDMSGAQLKRCSFNALLDDVQPVCEAVADEMQRRMKVGLGEHCPHCDASTVNSNGEYAECEACGEHWYHDEQGMDDMGM